MAIEYKYVVNDQQTRSRLDIFLSKQLKISRSSVQKLIKLGQVFVKGRQASKAGEMLKKNYVVEVRAPQANEEKKENIIANEPLIEVVSKEKDYLVVNKPSGLLTHPTQKNETDSLVGWLKKRHPEIEKIGDSRERPGIVHRLDKEASGLLVVARNQKMYDFLKKQFQDRKVEKEYLVLVYGVVKKDHDIVDFQIGRGKDGRMVSRPKTDVSRLKNLGKTLPGKTALTELDVEKRFGRFSLLRIRIHSGRTHQIRVHMFAYGYPVVGDDLYVNKKLVKKTEIKLGRLFLHAHKLCFQNLSGEKVCYSSDIPSDLSAYLSNLK